MVGQNVVREIKVGVLEKRSQNKSFFTKENFQTRVFILDTTALRYFTGTVNNRGDERGVIDLGSVLCVEAVADGLLDKRSNVFQVVYSYALDGEPIQLYCEADSSNNRDAWIKAIRTEAERNEAKFQARFHKGAWSKHQFTCCGSTDKDSEGCEMSTHDEKVPGHSNSMNVSMTSLGSGHGVRVSSLLVDTMWKRAQGRSTFFLSDNYKSRVFVLDANSLRYYDEHSKHRKKEKGRIHLSCIVTVEPVLLSSGYENAFQVVYFDEYELVRLYVVANSKADQDKWIQTVKREAVKMGAEFLPSYHIGTYDRRKGKWECCDDMNKFSEGCRRVIAQPDMKLCPTDLNTSVASSVNRPHTPLELKVACMWKRSQNKGYFRLDNYRRRVFTLDNMCLAYYSGYLEDRGHFRSSIPIIDMLVVEAVRDGMLENHKNVFQIVYLEDDEVYNLYIVAESDQERISWINAIKKEVSRCNVSLLPRYHPGVWLKKTAHYNCCGRLARTAAGCADVMGMSLVSVRDRLNTNDSIRGMRNRLGTLDSVPENAIVTTHSATSRARLDMASARRMRPARHLPSDPTQSNKEEPPRSEMVDTNWKRETTNTLMVPVMPVSSAPGLVVESHSNSVQSRSSNHDHDSDTLCSLPGQDGHLHGAALEPVEDPHIIPGQIDEYYTNPIPATPSRPLTRSGGLSRAPTVISDHPHSGLKSRTVSASTGEAMGYPEKRSASKSRGAGFIASQSSSRQHSSTSLMDMSRTSSRQPSSTTLNITKYSEDFESISDLEL